MNHKGHKGHKEGGEEDRGRAARKPITVADVAHMSVRKRMRLLDDIQESIVADSEAVRLTAGQKAEVDRRLRAKRRNPEAGIPWEVAKAWIRARHGKVK